MNPASTKSTTKSHPVPQHRRDPVARFLLRLSGDMKQKMTKNFVTMSIEMAIFFFPPSSLRDFLNMDLIIESQWIKHNTSNHC